MLQLAKGGDNLAIGQVLDGFRTYLTLLARIQIGRRLQSKADPDDVVQEAFLDAHRQFCHFRGETEDELAAWLRKIMAGHLAQLVRRYCATEARDVRLEYSIEQDLGSSSARLSRGLASPESTPSEKLRHREDLLVLAEMLEALPSDYRDVIVMRQIEGLSFGEICKRMDRSEDSVQKLWVRGLQALRLLIQQKTI
ncbi:MAG: sigma-70 family RNA polymerase sigma factor [Pirellula sp.]